ncbi:MAG TPA: hypothetical protein PKD54_02385, partial [Pirellulaceae bacterium]|nr:hypothetical protein [Pirellulaceae bacterium]
GIPLMLCGMWVVLQPAARKHAMHAAAGIAALGTLLAGSRAVMSIGKLWSDDPNVNRRAALFVILMTLICAVYVVLSVRSFIQARRRSADDTAV